MDDLLTLFHDGKLYIDIGNATKEQLDKLNDIVQLKWASGKRVNEWHPRALNGSIFIRNQPMCGFYGIRYRREIPEEPFVSVEYFLRNCNFSTKIKEEDFEALFA